MGPRIGHALRAKNWSRFWVPKFMFSGYGCLAVVTFLSGRLVLEQTSSRINMDEASVCLRQEVGRKQSSCTRADLVKVKP